MFEELRVSQDYGKRGEMGEVELDFFSVVLVSKCDDLGAMSNGAVRQGPTVNGCDVNRLR